jgi:uncharacterized protein (TIGR01370 family)
VVDGADTTAATVKRLQRKGAIVLGYLSVGTVESWRPWFGQLQDHRLEELGDWDGERYADTSSPELRDALADRIAPQLLEKGFDGLFLDNVDMVESHEAQADGMLDLVRRLSDRAHAAGGALMAQNGDAIIKPYLPYLDAWNREDPTGTFDFDAGKYAATDAAGRRSARATLKLVRTAGLLTTSTDYYASPTSKAAARAVRIACQAGAVPFVGDIDLKQVTAKPPRCSQPPAERGVGSKTVDYRRLQSPRRTQAGPPPAPRGARPTTPQPAPRRTQARASIQSAICSSSAVRCG